MSKMSTDRHALNGPTMGTRWTALFHAEGVDPGPVRQALQGAVDEVDAQMSVWKPDSDLMRLNAAPVGVPVALPSRLMAVLGLGLAVGRATGGAFDITLGDAVRAWGYGPEGATPAAIRAAMGRPRLPAWEALDLDPAAGRAVKRAPVSVDLNGIAKGYGTDRLAEVLREHGIEAALVGIDGEMRALGLRPDGEAWTVAVEAPDRKRRAPLSILALQDAAVATSGDYRHWVQVGDRLLSHTMDPVQGAPLRQSPASVTVVASGCAEADAFATALMVLGETEGLALAARLGLSALFLLRDGDTIRMASTGAVFDPAG
ncbi:FAD:protein FMN transferase [Pararhodobacter sp.]|uniref:FAD:protein FMN transferase n=1 Tax=Pararhodobacter sp. TaxID=2127056 RepID=UPI002AFFBEC1|nr:FAD:protein FMN transferase [Pararhodobacter sp.]